MRCPLQDHSSSGRLLLGRYTVLWPVFDRSVEPYLDGEFSLLLILFVPLCCSLCPIVGSTEFKARLRHHVKYYNKHCSNTCSYRRTQCLEEDCANMFCHVLLESDWQHVPFIERFMNLQVPTYHGHGRQNLSETYHRDAHLQHFFDDTMPWLWPA